MFEEVESKALKNCASCSPVPSKSSWRIRFGVPGFMSASTEPVDRARHPRERGVSFEREWNRGHALNGARNPPPPKLRETNCDFVPIFADLEKPKCSRGETGVAVLYPRLNDVEKDLRQHLRWQTGDDGVQVLGIY